MGLLIGLAVIILGPAFFFFFVSYSLKMRVEPNVEQIDFSELEGLDNKLIEKATSEFQKKGFRYAGDFSVNHGAGAMFYIRLFTDKDNFILAHAGYLICGKVKNFYIAFETDFEDGTEVSTSNNVYAKAFKHGEKKFEYQCPKADLNSLLEFHREQIAKIGDGKLFRRIPYDLLSTLKGDLKKLMCKQEEFKIFKKDRFGKFYRPTIFGALYMTWYQWLNVFFRYNPQVVKIRSSHSSFVIDDESSAIIEESSMEEMEPAVESITQTTQVKPEKVANEFTQMEQEKEILEKQLITGSNWFYWIAGMSLVNTIMAIAGNEAGFVLGLAITMVFDVIAKETGAIGLIISLIFNVTVIFSFIMLGIFANKKCRWAFMTGLIIYGLDTLLIFFSGFWLALVIHLLALYYIFKGFQATSKLVYRKNL